MTSLTRNKIFFHGGSGGGNLDGIGPAMRQLDAARIPFFLKMADNYGPIFEANGIALTSGVEHITVFRFSTGGQGGQIEYDVPDYNTTPEIAAKKHWETTRKRLPPEFHKRTWLELINEIDQERADWIGHFCAEIAVLANAEGYKVALPSWSSGEPEPIDFESPGQLRFLRYCAENKQVCAYSLHEYSYIVTDILHQYPYKIGRFHYLLATCDKHGIDRPTILITEWGWTLDNVPGVNQALIDIETVGNIYAPFPNILGAAIWYLGPGFGGIADKAQKLIQPLTDWALNNFIDVAELNPQIPPLPEIGDWKQMPDKITVEVPVEFEDKHNFIGQVRGIGDAKAVSLKYRWLYNNGTENVYGNWIVSSASIPELDIRGVEFMLGTTQTLSKTVTVEVDCPKA